LTLIVIYASLCIIKLLNKSEGIIMKHTVVTADYPIIQTTGGAVHGMEIDGVLTFRGIPYAQAERFAPPREVSWQGVKACYAYGDICPSEGTSLSTLYSTHRYWPASENCLNLNLWTSDVHAKKPVMFWIHGGGFSGGSSIDEALTDGDVLAKTGEVVVVSVNHRLNCLGFLDLRAYGERYKHSANLGLDDLVAALRWVHDNIASFGGDPDNVTVFGQSGGGGKIMALMQMPSADGLYHKAILQSGIMPISDTLRMSERHGQLTVQALGLDKKTIDEIQTIPYSRLCAASREALQQMGPGHFDAYGPHPDAEHVLDDFLTAGFRPETAHVPVMAGTCIGELSLFGPGGLKPSLFTQEEKDFLTHEEKVERLRSYFGDDAPQIAEALAQAYPGLDPLYATSIDMNIRPRNEQYVHARSGFASAAVYQYVLAYTVPVLEGKLAWHGADLGFCFGTLERSDSLCSGEHAHSLMVKMRDAWISFAKTGNPGVDSLPKWQAYTHEHPATMIFDTQCRCEESHDKQLLALLKKHQKPMF